MYSRLKQSKRALSFVLALVLVLNIVLSSGFFHVAVQAADEDAPSAVFYVDGVGSGNEDGSSADNAFKTIAQAYLQIPADNTKTVIVICGDVDMSADTGITTIKSTDNTNNYTATPFFATSTYYHTGEVVFTSTYNDVDYRTQNNAFFSLPVNYMLMGNTTFENLNIKHGANASSGGMTIYANYYTLHLGKGLDVSATQHKRFARDIYIGTSYANYNAIRYSKEVALDGIYGKNATFIMESGKVNYLHGLGNGYQGDGNYNKSFGVTLNIDGGAVDYLEATSTNLNAKISDINVCIGANANVTTLTLATDGLITGTKTITYKNRTGNVSVAGFDALELINSNITVASLETVRTIQTTDSSNLTVQEAPDAAIPVTVTKAGHKWTSNGALITAPKGTAEKMFTLTNTDGCAWEYADGNKATWTIVRDPDAFYVDGVNGSDENTGLSAEEPLKTLAAAYAKIDANNKVTYIVICGEVQLTDSLVNASASVAKKVIGKHAGTVVLTSKYENKDYRGEGVGLYLGKADWDLLGNTVLENVDIKEGAERIIANYYSFYIGEGIGGDLVSAKVILGFYGNALPNNSAFSSQRAKDIVFTMKSGTIGTLYGQGINNQGNANNADNEDYVPFNTTLNIEGGTFTDRVYMATNPTASPINNVTLNIVGKANGPKVQSYYDTPTVNGEVKCVVDLAGQNKKIVCNDTKCNLYVINTAYGSADGKNAAYLDTNGGYVSGAFIQKITQDPDSKMRYAVVKSGNKYIPHPFNLTFAQVGLNTKAGENDEDVAICLRAMYLASDKAKPTDYGICHLDENKQWVKHSAKESVYSFDGKNLVNAFYNLNGALEELDKTTSYRVYMVVNGVTVYSDAIVEITPRAVLTNINKQLENGGSITEAQYASLKNLVDNNSAVGEILTYFNNK